MFEKDITKSSHFESCVEFIEYLNKNYLNLFYNGQRLQFDKLLSKKLSGEHACSEHPTMLPIVPSVFYVWLQW